MRIGALLAAPALVIVLAAPGVALAISAENTPAACKDGEDNDGDGFVDCSDQDCSALVFCVGAAPVAPAAPPAPAASENTPSACKDGVDNDGDAQVDCSDQDCSVLVFCAGVTPAAPAAPAASENTPSACKDGVDNDGDGRVDCSDQDCSVLVFCAGVAPAAPVKPAPLEQPKAKGAPALPAGKVSVPPSVKPYSTEEIEILLGPEVAGTYGHHRGPMVAGMVFLAIGTGVALAGTLLYTAVGMGSMWSLPPAFFCMNIGFWLVYGGTEWKAKALIEAGFDVRNRKGGMIAGNVILNVLTAGGFGVLIAGMVAREIGMVFGGLGALLGATLIGGITFAVCQSKTEKSIKAVIDEIRARRLVAGIAPVPGGGVLTLGGTF